MLYRIYELVNDTFIGSQELPNYFNVNDLVLFVSYLIFFLIIYLIWYIIKYLFTFMRGY